MRGHLVEQRLGLGGRQAEMCAHFLEGHALQPHARKQRRLRRPPRRALMARDCNCAVGAIRMIKMPMPGTDMLHNCCIWG